MKMLICYDGSESARSALGKSIDMFRGEKPEVSLAAVAEEPADASSYDEAAFDELRAQNEADLKAAAEGVAKQGFTVDVVLAIGDPRKMLVEIIDRKNPDLVVIASRPPEGGIRFGKVTVSISDYVVRHVTERPILLMR